MASPHSVDDQYWQRRSNMMYYKYVDILVKAFAYHAKSIIDVGSANAKYVEAFHWIPEKYTLDISNPYTSPEVTAIEADFLTYIPSKKFDFATCFQVLEHIPDVEQFAKKLFDVSDRVLISVPYRWPEDAEKEHVNDPVDEEKLKQWTGREPSYSIVVSEPLRLPSKGISRRLVCYYGPEKNVDYRKAMDNVKALSKNELGSEAQLEKLFSEVEQSNQIYKDLQQDIKKVMSDQEKYYQLTKLELETFNLEQTAVNKAAENEKMEARMEALHKEINRYRERTEKLAREKKKYIKEHDKMLKSTSWKATAPVRLAGSVVKKVIKKKRM